MALPATNRLRDVAAFIAVFGVLFVLMALAVPPARRAAGSARTIRTVLGFGLLFRLLLVPAGLPAGGASPFGPPAERTLFERIAERSGAHARGLADDLAGRRAAFREHLLYDDDVWRYLWDGHVAAAGRDPYTRSPSEIEEDVESGAEPADLLAEPWPDVLDRVGFPTYRTVYPPGAQLLFLLVHAMAPASVVAWKLLVIAADLGTCALVVRLLRHLGRPPGEAVLYAWNPLAVKEIAGSGHVDAVMVLLAVLAVERIVAGRARTGLAALGASVVVKLGSAVLAPALLVATRPRSWWPLPVAGALLALPWPGGLPALARSLGVYGDEWTFNGGPWRLAEWLAGAAGAARPEVWAQAVCLAVLIAVIVVTTSEARRAAGADGRAEPAALVAAAFAALAAAAWLAPAVMPWYLLWALPFAVATGRRSWLLLCALSLLSYLVYAFHEERAWWLWLEHGAFAAALVAEEIGARRVRA